MNSQRAKGSPPVQLPPQHSQTRPVPGAPTVHTPPPVPRQGQFEDVGGFHPQYHQTTFAQGPGAYDMSKQAVASARMPGGPVAPPAQSRFMAGNNQPYYVTSHAQQQLRPQRMNTMPNGQMGNPMFLNQMPAMQYMGAPGQMTFPNQQGIQIVQQNPSQQYLYQQRYQMPQQQQQMYNIPQGFQAQGGAGYGQNVMYFSQMQQVPQPNPNRPPSTGPTGVMQQQQQQHQRRERKPLQIVCPNTGKDISSELIQSNTGGRPASSEPPPEANQSQIAAEFAAKVAERLQGGEGHMEGVMHEAPTSLVFSQPPPDLPPPELGSPTMVSAQEAAAQLEEDQQFAAMNGDPDPCIPPPEIGAPMVLPTMGQGPPLDSNAPNFTPQVAPEPVFTQPPPPVPPQPTPSPPEQTPERVVQPSPPVPAKETTPPIVPKEVSPAPEVKSEKEPSPAPETKPEPKDTSPAPEDISISSAAAAPDTPPATAAQDLQQSSSSSLPSQQPAAQDPPSKEPTQDSRSGPKDAGRNKKRNKKDLNKRGESKEGTDMDAFYDGSEKSSVKSASPEETPSTPVESTPSAPIPAAPAAAAPTPAAAAPVAAAPSPAAASPPPPASPTKVEESKPKKEATPEPAPVETSKPEPPSEPQPEKPAQKQDGLLPTPEVKITTPEPAAEERVNGMAEENEAEEEDEDAADKENGISLKYTYKEDQWSPLNPEGKRQYDRDFLLQLQTDPGSNQRPTNLPDLPDIILDRPSSMKSPLASLGKAFPDFTPGFFVKATQGRAGGQGSMSKRGSQQGRRGGGGPMMGEQRVIQGISINRDIQLHKSENAYKIGVRTSETASTEEVENAKLYRQFNSILNKLTPQKFTKLVEQALGLDISSEERIRKCTDLIFEKALSEPNFAVAYANMCKSLLSLPKVPSTADPNQFIQFRAVLLTKCQKEFESDASTELDLEARRKEALAAPEGAAKKELLEKISADETAARRRSTGNIRFIGELFKLRMLTENIMHDCIFKLLKARDEESLECLCRLITTIGKELDTAKAKPRMDQYFTQMHRLSEMKELPSRVRFMIRDVLDLREKSNWVPRRNENKPKTIDQIHKEAAAEKAQAQLMMSMPKSDTPSRGGAGKGGKGGRGSMGGEADPGWNTVLNNRTMRSIDASRMKLSKQNVDDTIQLGPGGGSKFSNWGMGSKGGGSRSQEQEKPPANRYGLLSSMGEDTGRRSFGRSPARGDSGNRGSGRMDRRDRDREPGGFGRGRMTARSSQEGEKERAIASARHLLGPGGSQGGSSNPSSRDASRDNSRSRESKPESSSSGTTGPDASLMSQDYIETRIKNIVEEFLHNQDYKEATDCVAEWRNLNHKDMVTTMMNTVLERSSQARLHLGELFFHLVSQRLLNERNLVAGLVDVNEFAEDMEIDVPKIYEYLGEIMGPMILDNAVLPLTFMRSSVEPLIKSGNGKAAPLLAQALHVACQRKPHSHVRTQFKQAGLQISDFVPAAKVNDFIKQRELEWLTQDTEGSSRPAQAAKSRPDGWVENQLTAMLQKGSVNNEHIFDFIEANVAEDDQKSDRFIRELITAVCRSAISGDSASSYKVTAPTILARRSLLLKYLENNPKLELQALYALQHLMCQMEHPPGILKALFDVLYDEEVISEESFYAWKDGDHPNEPVGRGVALMSANAFYAWLKEGEES